MYEPFFAYARERQTIFLKKTAGLPRPEWTSDPILSHYKFCCVFREDDRTTIWLRENVRKIQGPELLLATIVFRWFNRITTGEAIFIERDLLGDGRTAWEHFLEQRSVEPLRTAILKHCGSGPYVTGAYCIIGMPHMSKLDGILSCIENVVRDPAPSTLVAGFVNLYWTDLAYLMLSQEMHLEEVWEWFRKYPRSGDFMAYEIVTDLNHSHLMRGAPDRMTWANAGPGAIRGLNRLHDRPLEQRGNKENLNGQMQEILAASQSTEHWPQTLGAGALQSGYQIWTDLNRHPQSQWPAWDMRTVEHTLCEFDKYERIRLNQGSVKGIYR